ncbi:hypothetical protein ACP70R_000062 [Stipagrostis hirtigluma subsp. patula]
MLDEEMMVHYRAADSWPPAWFAFAALVAVGLCAAARAAATLLAWLHRAYLRPGRDLARRYGAWAVVTGATDGIGRAVALGLARRGVHLVLVGRSPEKLSRVAGEVRAAAPSCEVRTVVFDLAAGGDGPDDEMARGVARVAAAAEGLDVGILVNNAGATYPCAAYFHEVEAAAWEAVVRVNVEAATRITRALLPAMAARGRGAVVNVGSGSSVVVPAFPLYAVYAASKAISADCINAHLVFWQSAKAYEIIDMFRTCAATGLLKFRRSLILQQKIGKRIFAIDRLKNYAESSPLHHQSYNQGAKSQGPEICVAILPRKYEYIDQFSRSLNVEYKQYGVDIQCQIPLYVATKMAPIKGDSPFIPSPEEYAEAALRCIGYEARCVPYWRHSVQWFFASLLPDCALNQWRLQIGIRKRNEMKALLGENGFS